MQGELYLPTVKDGLLDTVFYTEGLSRTVRLDTFAEYSRYLTSAVLDDWDRESQWTSHVAAAKLLACEPALVKIAEGERVTQSTASEVRSNFSVLAQYLKDNGYTRPYDSDLNGEVTECAIMGTAWWAIECGYFPEGSHIRPSTTQQNASNSGGLKDGFDALLCVPKRAKVKLQFKRKHGEKKSLAYEDDIVVISPEQLTKPGAQKVTTNLLIDALCADHCGVLTDAAELLANIVIPPKKASDNVFDPAKYKGDLFHEHDVS